MRRHATTLVIFAIGWALIFFGVIAGFIPLVPGFVFIIIGFYIISRRSKWLTKLTNWMRRKNKRFDQVITSFDRATEYVVSRFRLAVAILRNLFGDMSQL